MYCHRKSEKKKSYEEILAPKRKPSHVIFNISRPHVETCVETSSK